MIVPLNELIVPSLRISERLLDSGILRTDPYGLLELIDNAYDALESDDGSAPLLAAFVVDIVILGLNSGDITIDHLDRYTLDAMLDGYEDSAAPDKRVAAFRD